MRFSCPANAKARIPKAALAPPTQANQAKPYLRHITASTGIATRHRILVAFVRISLSMTDLSMRVEDDGTPKPFAGQTYVVSGSVPGYTRNSVNERIEALGGTASSSVSAKTTALVTSETSTSKAKKAASLGIPVIDPAEFAVMLSAR